MPNRRRNIIGKSLAGAVAFAVIWGGSALPSQAEDDLLPRIDLRVLVVDDGTEVVNAIAERLATEGVPFTTVDLRDGSRPQITAEFLTVPDAAGPHAKFQGVVLPNATPTGLSTDELATLQDFERAFGVREVNAYVWPGPSYGVNWPAWSGTVDGLTATVASGGQADGFGYLANSFTLDDLSPDISESYGAYATPMDGPVTVTPLITIEVPGTGSNGVLLGAANDNGREVLFSSFAFNKWQRHSALITPGIISWLTRGTHLGIYRNYFSVHVDDVFLPDALWSEEGNCTIGDGCDPDIYPPDGPDATARMVAQDVTYLRNWQSAAGIYLDIVFNGYGVGEYETETGTSDPLFAAFNQGLTDYRWVNHTWEHLYLGCLQDGSTDPWQCQRDSANQIRYTSKAVIDSEIANNIVFAQQAGIPLDPTELVTGEHSGLASLPQMTVDNPNLLSSLATNGVRWVASDASRETAQRAAGSALTVPRHPMNIFYNVATKSQEVDEYNWIYTSRANGGSGLCEDHSDVSTCIAPLDTTTGFDSYIVPLEVSIAWGHVLNNDPRPHYAHQTNLTQDRILYPVVDGVLANYRATFAANTPLINPSMAEAGAVLQQQATWQAAAQPTATLVGDTVRLRSTGKAAKVPVTLPSGSKLAGAAFGSAYAGTNSGWYDLARNRTAVFQLPGEVGYRAPAEWPVAPGESAPSTVVPPANAPAVLRGTNIPALPDASDGLVPEPSGDLK